jgi:hypothetical protein
VLPDKTGPPRPRHAAGGPGDSDPDQPTKAWNFDKFHYSHPEHSVPPVMLWGNTETFNGQSPEMHIKALVKALAQKSNNKGWFQTMVKHWEICGRLKSMAKQHLSEEDLAVEAALKKVKREQAAACEMGVRTPLCWMSVRWQANEHHATCCGKHDNGRICFDLWRCRPDLPNNTAPQVPPTPPLLYIVGPRQQSW